MEIPVIDVSKLDGEKRVEILAQIANGCENWGFFELVNHGIPEELLERVKNLSSQTSKLRAAAFKKSVPVKLLNQLIAQEDEGKAAQKLEDVDWEDVFLLNDDNEWPSDPAEFKPDAMKEYRAELIKLAYRVMEAMEENLGLDKGCLKKSFNAGGEHAPIYRTKVSHYPPCPRPDLVDGLRAHTDVGGLVLLLHDGKVGSLQILKDGEWIDLQSRKNSILINIGDQIEVLSNGRYKSVLHRALATNDGTRAISSFLNPSLKATIAPAITKVAATELETVVYPKFVFGDYVDVYNKQKFAPKERRFKAVAAAN